MTIEKEDFKGLNMKLDALSELVRMDVYQSADQDLQDKDLEDVRQRITVAVTELNRWNERWRTNITYPSKGNVVGNVECYIDQPCLELKEKLEREEENLSYKLSVINRYNSFDELGSIPIPVRSYPKSFKYKVNK